MSNNKKYIIREFYKLCDGAVCSDLLTEFEKQDIKNNNAFYVTGVAQRADYKNGNGRRYPYDVLLGQVQKYQKLIEQGRSAGELNHPEDSVINPHNVSHKVVRIWWEGKDVMVTLKLLSTPAGEIAKKLITEGVAIGLSSRGLGSVRETPGGIIVENDFQLICFDIVLEPSVQDAFMHLNEAKDYNIKPFSSKEERINNILSEIVRI